MRSLIRSVAATVAVAAAGLVWAPSAGATACSTGDGVTVVVDFQELGGGIEQDCVADQGTADDLFVAAGHTLQNVNGQAFVCRVDGLPTQEQESCARTPPADAYWGLWWSDGESGSWTYSSQGAYSLDVPEGGSVAFSWNGSTTKSPPGAPPPEHSTDEPSEEPQPTEESTTRPSQPPTSGGGTTGGGATSSPSPSASTSASSDPRERSGRLGDREGEDPDRGKQGDRDREDSTRDPAAEPSPTPSDETAAVAELPASGEDSALPVWVGPVAVGGLLGAAGLATYLRRRASRTP